MGVLLRLPLQEVPLRLEGMLTIPTSQGVRLSRLPCEMGQCFRKNFFDLVEGPRLEHQVRLALPRLTRPKRVLEVLESFGGDEMVETHLSTLMYFIQNRELRASLKVSSLHFELRGAGGNLCSVVLTWYKPAEISRAQSREPSLKIAELGLIAYERPRSKRDSAHTHFLGAGAMLVVPAVHRQTTLFS